MACSIKQSPLSITPDFIPKRGFNFNSNLGFLPKTKIQNCDFSTKKHLYISSVTKFGSFSRIGTICKAYEADKSQPLDVNIELPKSLEAAAQRVKISIYFATWWALNVVFNIYNKKVLNAYPFPWLTSTLSLATGSLIMLISWVTRIAEFPKTDLEFWKSLFPVRILIF